MRPGIVTIHEIKRGNKVGQSNFSRKRIDGVSSKYNGVSYCSKSWKSTGGWASSVMIKGKLFRSHHKTERDAAIASDKIYIEHKMYNLLNILKPVNK